MGSIKNPNPLAEQQRLREKLEREKVMKVAAKMNVPQYGRGVKKLLKTLKNTVG